MSQKLYQKVINFINNKINSGDLIIGDLIPSESQLSKQLNVSIGTVRKAIDKLNVVFNHHSCCFQYSFNLSNDSQSKRKGNSNIKNHGLHSISASSHFLNIRSNYWFFGHIDRFADRSCSNAKYRFSY